MRKGINIIFSSLVVLGIGITVATLIFVLSSLGAEDTTPIYKLELVSATLTGPVAMENAGWQIALIVDNLGNRDMLIDKVYVNGELVEEMGLVHWGRLSSTESIGTSLVEGGAVLSPGSMTFHVWVGEDLYHTGSFVTVEVQQRDVFRLRKVVTLN